MRAQEGLEGRNWVVRLQAWSDGKLSPARSPNGASVAELFAVRAYWLKKVS